jgi:hypothetical protein
MRLKSKKLFDDDDYKEDEELTEAYERAMDRKKRHQLTPKPRRYQLTPKQEPMPTPEQKPLYYRKKPGRQSYV